MSSGLAGSSPSTLTQSLAPSSMVTCATVSCRPAGASEVKVSGTGVAPWAEGPMPPMNSALAATTRSHPVMMRCPHGLPTDTAAARLNPPSTCPPNVSRSVVMSVDVASSSALLLLMGTGPSSFSSAALAARGKVISQNRRRLTDSGQPCFMLPSFYPPSGLCQKRQTTAGQQEANPSSP